MKKRMLSALLCLCMMLTMMPAAFAADDVSKHQDKTVNSAEELKTAIDGATAGDKIIVGGSINLGNDSITVKDGVTLDVGTYQLTGTVVAAAGSSIYVQDDDTEYKMIGVDSMNVVSGSASITFTADGTTTTIPEDAVAEIVGTFMDSGDGDDAYRIPKKDKLIVDGVLNVNVPMEASGVVDVNGEINVNDTLELVALKDGSDNGTLEIAETGSVAVKSGATLDVGAYYATGKITAEPSATVAVWDDGIKQTMIGTNALDVISGTVDVNFTENEGTTTTINEDSEATVSGTFMDLGNGSNSYRIPKKDKMVVNGKLNVTYPVETAGSVSVNGEVVIIDGNALELVALVSGETSGTMNIAANGYVAVQANASLNTTNGTLTGNGTIYTETGANFTGSISNTGIKVVEDAKIYTVTFDADGGKFADGTEADKQLATGYDGKLDETEVTALDPEGDNYDFEGWAFEDNTRYDSTYAFTADTTLHAVWDRRSSGGSSGGSGSSSYAVSVSSVSNGSVTVSPKNASKGATVTITVTPDEGYELDTLTVTDKDGNNIRLTNAGDGKYTFTMPSSKVTVTANFTAVEEIPGQVGSFTDVNTDDWFAEAVQYMLDNEMMNGTSATTFSPSTTTTRGMIVTILYRLEGEPDAAASSFTDVASNMYYADAINWAAANGIVNGITTTTFGPDNAITREQMAAILYRYAQYKGYDVTASNDLGRYTDASQISAYATAAMQWANAEGLITGNTTTTINPIGNATRAEVATILMRFCENIAG